MIANTLFHFTEKIQTLSKIIESRQFRASYNIEDVSDFYPQEKFVGIPMICFCDIPLKFLSDHPMTYGQFGIGMKKEWGLSNGINPILYRTEKSSVGPYLNQMLETTKRKTTLDFFSLYSLTVIRDKILRFSSFSKKYESDNILYYLEREWRYVPSSAEITFTKTKREKGRLNKAYFSRQPDFLKFSLSDIKYIITPNKTESASLIREVEKLNIERSDKNLMIQLIIDLNSIKKDF